MQITILGDGALGRAAADTAREAGHDVRSRRPPGRRATRPELARRRRPRRVLPPGCGGHERGRCAGRGRSPPGHRDHRLGRRPRARRGPGRRPRRGGRRLVELQPRGRPVRAPRRCGRRPVRPGRRLRSIPRRVAPPGQARPAVGHGARPRRTHRRPAPGPRDARRPRGRVGARGCVAGHAPGRLRRRRRDPRTPADRPRPDSPTPPGSSPRPTGCCVPSDPPASIPSTRSSTSSSPAARSPPDPRATPARSVPHRPTPKGVPR